MERIRLLPDYYDLVVFGIHHFGISSVCYCKQMPERDRVHQLTNANITFREMKLSSKIYPFCCVFTI